MKALALRADPPHAQSRTADDHGRGLPRTQFAQRFYWRDLVFNTFYVYYKLVAVGALFAFAAVLFFFAIVSWVFADIPSLSATILVDTLPLVQYSAATFQCSYHMNAILTR